MIFVCLSCCALLSVDWCKGSETLFCWRLYCSRSSSARAW